MKKKNIFFSFMRASGAHGLARYAKMPWLEPGLKVSILDENYLINFRQLQRKTTVTRLRPELGDTARRPALANRSAKTETFSARTANKS
jgi:hypothetical protein